jgi:hypothetical protein
MSDVPMLSDAQQETLWRAWLSAETRAGYFAALGTRFQATQRVLVCGSLLLASGATLTLVATAPQSYVWLKPVLTVLAALLSLWSLVAKNERNAIDCSDLHFRWNTLAMDYEDLWTNMYADDAQERLVVLRKREAELSKSSTSMPEKRDLLIKAQDNVMMHHGAQMA